MPAERARAADGVVGMLEVEEGRDSAGVAPRRLDRLRVRDDEGAW